MTGRELREFRLSMGMTQRDFGRELGMGAPQVQIAKLEASPKPIRPRLVATIAKWMENNSLKAGKKKS